MSHRKEYFKRYNEEYRKLGKKVDLPDNQEEPRSHLIGIRLREIDYRFLEQLASERRYEGSPRSFVRSKRLGEAMNVEDFTVETLESILAGERLRRSLDPENYDVIVCPNPECGQHQWVNKLAIVDAWRCNKCLTELEVPTN